MTIKEIEHKFVKYCSSIKKCTDCKYYDKEGSLKCELRFAYDLGRGERK